MRNRNPINGMIQRIFHRYYERREMLRVKMFKENVQNWYKTCEQISNICGDALYDHSQYPSDIGEMLDKVDRNLFQLHSFAADTRRAIRRYDDDLARRVEGITQLVFNLRNKTASFLIRAQGPDPFSRLHPDWDSMRYQYYLRALDSAGFIARDIKNNLDKEMQLVRVDIETWVYKVEKTLYF